MRGHVGKMGRHDDTAGHGHGNLLVFLVACRSRGDVPKTFRGVDQHGCVTSELRVPEPDALSQLALCVDVENF